ncbi:MAG TPA: hypothetical protein PKA37_06250, partial [Planctomycetota bacterium]|nr:hypothetical protein [Planctomycetota bacterium]
SRRAKQTSKAKRTWRADERDSAAEPPFAAGGAWGLVDFAVGSLQVAFYNCPILALTAELSFWREFWI